MELALAAVMVTATTIFFSILYVVLERLERRRDHRLLMADRIHHARQKRSSNPNNAANQRPSIPLEHVA